MPPQSVSTDTPAPQPSTEDQTRGTMLPSQADAALLADFDRYMELSEDLNPSAVDRLAARFPNSDRDVLRDVLASCEGDEAAAIALLGGSSPPTDSDAALAAQLQQRENARARVEQRSRTARHRRNDAIVPLEKPVLDHMVSTLREIVVPALRAHFEELVLPDMRDTSGAVEYGLENMQVSALSLPEGNIVVRAAQDLRSIRVHVVNVYLELEVGRWSYESKGFVPVRDAGTARASVHGMSVAMRLVPRWSHAGGTKIVISDCDVTIDGVVRFKTQGAAADWAYNAIAVVFKPLVVSYIKEAVGNTVASALAVHLRQWSFSSALDDDRPTNHANNTTQAPVTAAE